MNDVTVNGGFSVSRVSKAGKETYRGAWGVALSGNAKEKAAMEFEMFKGLVRHNNWRAIMREVCRVFPAKSLKKAPSVLFSGEDVLFCSRADDGREVFERFDSSNPNTATSHAYCKALLEATAGTVLKGEKARVAERAQWLLDDAAARAEALRLESEAAPVTNP